MHPGQTWQPALLFHLLLCSSQMALKDEECPFGMAVLHLAQSRQQPASPELDLHTTHTQPNASRPSTGSHRPNIPPTQGTHHSVCHNPVAQLYLHKTHPPQSGHLVWLAGWMACSHWGF